MKTPEGASVLEAGTIGVIPVVYNVDGPSVHASNGQEMAIPVMKDGFEFHTPHSVSPLVGNRTGNFLLVKLLEI